MTTNDQLSSHSQTTLCPLPATRRKGNWIDIAHPPFGGNASYRALKDWLRPFGFRVIDYDGFAFHARIWYQRGRTRQLTALLVTPYHLLLTTSKHADRLAGVLSALEMPDE